MSGLSPQSNIMKEHGMAWEKEILILKSYSVVTDIAQKAKGSKGERSIVCNGTKSPNSKWIKIAYLIFRKSTFSLGYDKNNGRLNLSYPSDLFEPTIAALNSAQHIYVWYGKIDKYEHAGYRTDHSLPVSRTRTEQQAEEIIENYIKQKPLP